MLPISVRVEAKALTVYKALHDLPCLSALTCPPFPVHPLLSHWPPCCFTRSQACSHPGAFALAASTACTTLSSLPLNLYFPGKLFLTILLKSAFCPLPSISSPWIVFLYSIYHHLQIQTVYFIYLPCNYVSPLIKMKAPQGQKRWSTLLTVVS